MPLYVDINVLPKLNTPTIYVTTVSDTEINVTVLGTNPVGTVYYVEKFVGGSWVLFSTPTATASTFSMSFTDSGLIPTTFYEYRVRATNGNVNPNSEYAYGFSTTFVTGAMVIDCVKNKNFIVKLYKGLPLNTIYPKVFCLGIDPLGNKPIYTTSYLPVNDPIVYEFVFQLLTIVKGCTYLCLDEKYGNLVMKFPNAPTNETGVVGVAPVISNFTITQVNNNTFTLNFSYTGTPNFDTSVSGIGFNSPLGTVQFSQNTSLTQITSTITNINVNPATGLNLKLFVTNAYGSDFRDVLIPVTVQPVGSVNPVQFTITPFVINSGDNITLNWSYTNPQFLVNAKLYNQSITNFESSGLYRGNSYADVTANNSRTFNNLTESTCFTLSPGSSDGGVSEESLQVWVKPYNRNVLNNFFNREVKLYYQFEENGTQIKNSFNNTDVSYPPYPFSGISYVPGKVGNAIQLTNTYIKEPVHTGNPSVGFFDGKSLCFWVKGYVNGYAGLFYQGDLNFSSSLGLNCYTIGLNSTTFETEIHFELIENNVVIASAIKTVTMNNTDWEIYGFEVFYFNSLYRLAFNKTSTTSGVEFASSPTNTNTMNRVNSNFHLGRAVNISGGYYESGVRGFDEVFISESLFFSGNTSKVASNNRMLDALYTLANL